MASTTTLKNASRALGYDLWSDPDGSHYLVDYDGVKLRRWDPEHDDGDALRLAVKLRLDITFYNGFQEVHVEVSSGDGVSPTIELYGEELYSSTRQAIIKEAAKIGAAL